jgi:hypothetical protein
MAQQCILFAQKRDGDGKWRRDNQRGQLIMRIHNNIVHFDDLSPLWGFRPLFPTILSASPVQGIFGIICELTSGMFICGHRFPSSRDPSAIRHSLIQLCAYHRSIGSPDLGLSPFLFSVLYIPSQIRNMDLLKHGHMDLLNKMHDGKPFRRTTDDMRSFALILTDPRHVCIRLLFAIF